MIHNIKYIFCINTGRSGSKYVQELLSHTVGCASFHEPNPIGNGKAMRAFLAGKPGLMREVVGEKLENIKKSLADAEVYAETNHCFIKGFGWLLPEYLPQSEIGVVILTRKKEAIVKSMRSIHSTPLKIGAERWLMMPDMPHPLVPPPKRFLSAAVDYKIMKRMFMFFDTFPERVAAYEQECIEWYIAETAARAELYQRTFPEISYFQADVEELNNLAGVKRMLDFFGLVPDRTMEQAIGQPVNMPRPEIAPHPIRRFLYNLRPERLPER